MANMPEAYAWYSQKLFTLGSLNVMHGDVNKAGL